MTSGGFDPLGGDSGFEVYPQALRAATNEVFAAREKITKFASGDLAPLTLRNEDVGMLGVRSGIVEVFNAAIQSLREKSERGAERLTALAEALDKAADYYETQDEEDYRRLRAKEEG
ncbi:hypothetical protein [Amycolatopsis sp. SID8362]|uniref:hypothetical protein n=1 Tax=Amycolatopsis sp. SID8362 TaxID=2690346 RepID=UPI001370ECCF|nr:hypothetical protein [Amycolatopsis sp. SID8362]NBH09750.1 hypothetical protein [Amycolatopsis sp. SID8362]NED46443.1 hypothetical protein [Amycolatopsis sp. SID8362]